MRPQFDLKPWYLWYLSVLHCLGIVYAVYELEQYLNFANKTVFLCFLFFPFVKGHKEWLTEVQFLSIVSHPNLVKLLGYCSVDGERGIQRLLVYEFMPNKSLEDHLFSRSLPPLPWKTRLQIMLGAAQGLQYLHEGLEIQVPPSSKVFENC